MRNKYSSRSHALFLVTVRRENLVSKTKQLSQLYLVDLAGSEKVGECFIFVHNDEQSALGLLDFDFWFQWLHSQQLSFNNFSPVLR